MSITAAMVDSREPLWIQELDFGVPTVVTALDAGDVMVATDDGQVLLIERKSSSDLMASIADGRLFDQAARMHEQSPWSYVVVTEPITSMGGKIPGSGWAYSAVMGALLTVQELGVCVTWADGPRDFGPCVVRLANRKREPARMLAKPARGLATIAPGADILAALPGIGPERALALLEHLPSAAWAIQYLTDTSWPKAPVPGIAEGSRKKVRAALGLENEFMLGLLPVTNGETR
jgi:ERCC4-type nuclease